MRQTAIPVLSVIVPMFQDRADVLEVYDAYKAAVERIGRPYELIYVLSWQSERALADLQGLQADPDLAAETTRDALRRLHDELRGIKVPKASGTRTTPPNR